MSVLYPVPQRPPQPVAKPQIVQMRDADPVGAVAALIGAAAVFAAGTLAGAGGAEIALVGAAATTATGTLSATGDVAAELPFLTMAPMMPAGWDR